MGRGSEGGHRNLARVWAQRRGGQRGVVLGGFGVLGGSTEAVSPCPRAARCVRMREPSLLPVLLPSARRWPGGASRGLYALLTHFLPSVSNSSWRLLLPAFFQLKKKKKSPRHLLGARLPEAQALPCPSPGGWGCAGRGQRVPSVPLFVSVPEAQRDRSACRCGSGCCESQLVLFGGAGRVGGLWGVAGWDVALQSPSLLRRRAAEGPCGRATFAVPALSPKQPQSAFVRPGRGRETWARVGPQHRVSPLVGHRGTGRGDAVGPRRRACVARGPSCCIPVPPSFSCSPSASALWLGTGTAVGTERDVGGLGTCPPCGTALCGAADAFPQGTRAVCGHGAMFCSLAG